MWRVCSIGALLSHLALLIRPKNIAALSSVVSFGSSEFCKQIRGLSPHQRVMCQAQPRSIVVVSEGVQMAMHECRWQFRNNRWNCTNDGNDTVFGTELRVASKETAYDYAIKSAGILYAIVTACGQGRLSECGCDTRNHPFYRARRRTPQRIDRSGGVGMSEKWRWGGCSVDIAYGLNYTRRFMDAREVRRNERSLMNIHNYEAGRMVIKQHLLKACRCHGVSGSCTMRTCWITLPSFRSVGAILRERFSDAKQVEAWQSGARRRPTALKLVDRFTKPRTNDLVFLDKSPRFCERQPRTGSVGTHGRQCNSTSRAADSCGSLCCGRGYQVEEYDTTEMCRCKFLWCCVVTCEKCVRRVRKYTCN